MPEVRLFVGPTAHGVAPATLRRGGVRVLPPVRRGDVARLLAPGAKPSVLVICDGVFQSEPAVSHAEICRALDAGWQVWGVSSIGAIRAHELRSEGMHGWGYVHSMFSRLADFTDDEMCLLHFPEEPYFAVSEPLVNLRFALEQMRHALGISAAGERRVLAALRKLWFGERTEACIRNALVEHARIDAARAEGLLEFMRLNRVKTLDLLDLMAQRPWEPSLE